jgi:hypothetical protein
MNKAIEIIKPIALKMREKHHLLPSLTGGQIVKESGWLKSVICNNCLGIKCVGDRKNCCQSWTKEWVGDHLESKNLWFQAFDSIEECVEVGYVKVLMLDRYKDTRECENFFTASNQVRLDGYATGPQYHLGLRDIILQNKFYEWDWYNDPDENIADNFIWRESFSSCFHRRRSYLPSVTWKRVIEPPEYLWNNVVEVADQVQKLRNIIRKPLVVNSWYRTPEFNAVLPSSSPTSYHLTARAIDLRLPRGYTANDLIKIAYDNTNFRGFGIGRNYIHMDLRDKYTIWYY